MIELKHLTKKYDHFLAVEDLNLKIETGEFFGLLGPNGAGKTTLILLLCRLYEPTHGRILLNGIDMIMKNIWQCLVWYFRISNCSL